jgi:deazaflavin-dependent oxidoreductase (nitroreductase family)
MANQPDWNANNRPVIEEFRANGGKDGIVLLTTTGAKSGLPRINPLCYTTDGDRLIVIASKGGSPTHPDWYRNLVANPELTVELGPERFKARAIVAEGAERRRLYDQMAKKFPFFADYEKKTAREIPLVILERLGA